MLRVAGQLPFAPRYCFLNYFSHTVTTVRSA